MHLLEMIILQDDDSQTIEFDSGIIDVDENFFVENNFKTIFDIWNKFTKTLIF